MQRLRELMAPADARPGYDRPGSLYAAGAVGERAPAIDRRNALPLPNGGDVDPDRPARGEVARPRAGDRPGRVTRNTPEAPPERDARTELLAALRSSSSLRTAILLREVLDAPVALRDDHRQR